VIAGSVLSVCAVLLFYRFQNFSRAVFVLDGIILLFLLVGSRMAFRLIRELLPNAAVTDGRCVLIYGAGDGGEMVLRELRNNPAWNYRPVCFVDDDPLKQGKVINGLQVFDANGSLAQICSDKSIEEILISSPKISTESLARIRDFCRERDIALKRAQLKIEPVDFE
jgi:UDP-GlcNAc:undecaprenyl-phosphate GlcNAc-1-phosphate transferase